MQSTNRIPVNMIIKVLSVIIVATAAWVTISWRVSSMSSAVAQNTVQNERDKQTALIVQYHERQLIEQRETTKEIRAELAKMNLNIARLATTIEERTGH